MKEAGSNLIAGPIVEVKVACLIFEGPIEVINTLAFSLISSFFWESLPKVVWITGAFGSVRYS